MTLFWLAVIGAICYAVSLYVWPFTTCPRCKGGGRNKGSNRRRFGTCKRCGGSGRKPRPGSRFAHRTVLAVASERRKARERRARQRGEL